MKWKCGLAGVRLSHCGLPSSRPPPFSGSPPSSVPPAGAQAPRLLSGDTAGVQLPRTAVLGPRLQQKVWVWGGGEYSGMGAGGVYAGLHRVGDGREINV